MPDTASAPNWTLPQVSHVYRLPLFELIAQAHALHVQYHPKGEVQLCHLLSVKTGGCPEDCAYCPQAARYHTGVEAAPLLSHAEVLAAAERARAAGSTRFCMGAAWRHVKDGPEFDRVLEMVRDVAGLGLEVCCTLGMLGPQQAERLAAAGLTAYNHNLDTSPEFYGHIISTRTYDDRLRTIDNVRRAGISVCCGGILGMGESETDRISLLYTLANLNPPPESIPINALVPVAGTPLAEQPEPPAAIEAFEFIRAIATARVLMPRSKVRLSAGRLALSREAQALCFYAGANSIFVGDKLLTTPNPDQDHDRALLQLLGLQAEPPTPAARRHAAPAGSGPTAGQPARLTMEAAWQSDLDADRRRARCRTLPPPVAADDDFCTNDFCSNDYLGLTRHPAIRAAVARALRDDGDGMALGSTGSRLVSGNHPAITALEAEFAAWRGTEAALFYSSGYAAGVGVLSTLLRRQDIVFSDAHNHASLIDGMRLSGAQRVIVPHNDVAAFSAALRRHPAMGDQRRFLVVESLYSMDGDWAPLAELADACACAGVAMIVDEAHATGITGPGGAGCVAARPEINDIEDVVVATLHPCGKALGAAGALVAGSRLLRDYLINHSRSFVFSTAPPPILAVQISAAIRVIQQEPELARELAAQARRLREQLTAQGWAPGGDPGSPIVPLVLGSDEAALEAAAALTAAGFAVRAIRPPSVPEGTARLRLTVHTGHAAPHPDAARRLAALLPQAPGLRPPADARAAVGALPPAPALR